MVLKGEALGVKQDGGILEQLLREIEIECLPADIPKLIEVDISHLRLRGRSARGESTAQRQAEVPDRRAQMIAHITSVKEEVVVSPDAAADAAATPAEPEVIKKGKQEVEGEEGAAAEGKGKAEPKAEKKEKK